MPQGHGKTDSPGGRGGGMMRSYTMRGGLALMQSRMLMHGCCVKNTCLKTMIYTAMVIDEACVFAIWT